ncbi:hypothetical protein [Actinotalea sp. K2]|uniref:hypothetical protein n=1 Tax=Actinotalea sp. K2 TaxID=2939438 RepID=UPI0020175499|nr:hypothetical protein [Actinotalea sp. K2]
MHGAARALSALVLVVVAGAQEASLWTGAAPSYVEYTGLMWDASWYRQIAVEGYPTELPRGADGAVLQNAWAFFPLFPTLVRVLMVVTGAPWEVVAPSLALVLGAAAMLVVHRLVLGAAERLPARGGVRVPPRGLALGTVAVLSTAPASPVLQVAYTESLALLLVAAVLLALREHRYLAAVPLVLALGLTRAVALPVLVAVLVHGLHRWWAMRDGGSMRSADRLGLAVLGVASAVAGVLWPIVCALVTGVPGAYLQTQAAWRARPEVVPLVPWLDMARWLAGPWGVVLLAVVVMLLLALVLGRTLRDLGPELSGWTTGYLAYLLLVVEPGTSLVRFLLLAVGLAPAVLLGVVRLLVAGAPAARAPGARWPARALVGGTAALVVLGVAGQVWWVWTLWRLIPPADWPP